MAKAKKPRKGKSKPRPAGVEELEFETTAKSPRKGKRRPKA